MSLLDVKIYYEDTDCGGVVYYANYLRYFERARTEYFVERGLSLRDYMQQGIVFVVARAEVSYEASAYYGDILTIDSQIDQVKKVSFVFNHIVHRKGEDTVLVRSAVKLGCVNGAGKPTRIPSTIIAAL